MGRQARAEMEPVRQRTQYTCVPASLAMCLRALGHDVTEDIVNKVMGAAPMKGARWEEVLAAAQHFGCRATLTMPSTVEQLKAWTDAGTPVMIAWNPEGRPWSHASAVFDVEEREDGLYVHVADPNMPNPKKTVRVVSEDDFYGKWYEKTADYLVRRPAVAIEREITAEGHQVNILSGEEALPFATKLLASRTASQAQPTISWEFQRHVSVPVLQGTPSTRRAPDGSNWGGSIWSFDIIQRGEPNRTLPEDNYLRGGNKPGTEFWQVEIFLPGRKRVKPKLKWPKKDLEKVKDWCLRVLRGQVRVPGVKMANPKKTIRVVHEDEFYGKWYEKASNYLIRRPAVAIEREITPTGKQVMASIKKYPVEIVHVSGSNVTLKGDGHIALQKGIVVPAGWLPVRRPSVGDEFLATHNPGDRKQPWSFVEMDFGMVASQKRLAGRWRDEDNSHHFQWEARSRGMSVRDYEKSLDQEAQSGADFYRVLHEAYKTWQEIALRAYAVDNPDPGIPALLKWWEGRREPNSFEWPKGVKHHVKDSRTVSELLDLGTRVYNAIEAPFMASQGEPRNLKSELPSWLTAMESRAKQFRGASLLEQVWGRMASETDPAEDSETASSKKPEVKVRNPVSKGMAETGGKGQGRHKNKQDFERGKSRKTKHKKEWTERSAQADEKLFTRAAMLLQYMSEREVMAHLFKEGVDKHDVYLAVKAGKILNEKSTRRASVNGEETYFLAKDGKWYLEYIVYDDNDDDDDDNESGEISFHGPFSSEKAAQDYQYRNLSNTGGSMTDASGRQAPPKRQDLGKWRRFGSAPETELRWLSQVPGARANETLAIAVSSLASIHESEGYISSDAEGALEEYFYDMASQGLSFPKPGHWSLLLAKALRVNVRALWQKQASKPYSGNPDGKPIYPNAVNHGDVGEPLSGGTDIMRRVQNNLLHEQGSPQRPRSPEASLRLRADRHERAVNRVAADWMGDSE